MSIQRYLAEKTLGVSYSLLHRTSFFLSAIHAPRAAFLHLPRVGQRSDQPLRTRDLVYLARPPRSMRFAELMKLCYI